MLPKQVACPHCGGIRWPSQMVGEYCKFCKGKSDLKTSDWWVSRFEKCKIEFLHKEIARLDKALGRKVNQAVYGVGARCSQLGDLEDRGNAIAKKLAARTKS